MAIPSPDNPQVEKLLYTKKDAAFALSISIRSLEYLVARKKLPFRRIGNRAMFAAADVRRFARADHVESIR